jgi:hypothetical protein
LNPVRVLGFLFFTCHITFRHHNRVLLLVSRMFEWFRIRTQWHNFHDSCQLFHLRFHTFTPLHFSFRKQFKINFHHFFLQSNLYGIFKSSGMLLCVDW